MPARFRAIAGHGVAHVAEPGRLGRLDRIGARVAPAPARSARHGCDRRARVRCVPWPVIPHWPGRERDAHGTSRCYAWLKGWDPCQLDRRSLARAQIRLEHQLGMTNQSSARRRPTCCALLVLVMHKVSLRTAAYTPLARSRYLGSVFPPTRRDRDHASGPALALRAAGHLQFRAPERPGPQVRLPVRGGRDDRDRRCRRRRSSASRDITPSLDLLGESVAAKPRRRPRGTSTSRCSTGWRRAGSRSTSRSS